MASSVILMSVMFQGGTKLERARDLFEQSLDGCPPKFAKGRVLPMWCRNMFDVMLDKIRRNRHKALASC